MRRGRGRAGCRPPLLNLQGGPPPLVDLASARLSDVSSKLLFIRPRVLEARPREGPAAMLARVLGAQNRVLQRPPRSASKFVSDGSGVLPFIPQRVLDARAREGPAVNLAQTTVSSLNLRCTCTFAESKWVWISGAKA